MILNHNVSVLRIKNVFLRKINNNNIVINQQVENEIKLTKTLKNIVD